MTNLLFVYGTLKRGCGNNRVLHKPESKFVCNATLHDYKMYSLGGFPGIIEGKGGIVRGEVWQVSDENWSHLDSLEGCRTGIKFDENNMYNRNVVTVWNEETDTYYEVYTYVWNGRVSLDRLIPNGNW